MLMITYWGHSCFEVFLKDSQEKNIIFDPFDESTGDFLLNTKAWLILCSHGHFDHNAWKRVARSDSIHLVGFVGEKEVDNVKITGIQLYHDPAQGSLRGKNSGYIVELGGFSLLHLGDLGHTLDEKSLNKIGSKGRVNILFIPVGGVYTINPEDAITVIQQINPNIAIPMHYRTPRHNKGIFGGLSTLEDFIKLAERNYSIIRHGTNKIEIALDMLPEKTEIHVLTI